MDICFLMFVLSRRKQWLAWCLATIFVLTQTLGLIHGVTHTRLHASAVQFSLKPASTKTGKQDQLVARAAQPETSWAAAAFSSHKQDADCRLYDQCSHGAGAVTVLCQVLPVLAPLSQVAIFQGNALARWAALFDARGPPLTV